MNDGFMDSTLDEGLQLLKGKLWLCYAMTLGGVDNYLNFKPAKQIHLQLYVTLFTHVMDNPIKCD